MNLVNELSDEQIRLLKEADVVVEDRDYTCEECDLLLNKIIGYIMNFSKRDINKAVKRYESIMDKIKF